MAREISLGTERQNFLKEAVYMETMTRVQWHLKYYDEVTAQNKLKDPTPEQLQENRTKKFWGFVPQFPEGRVLPVIKYPPKGRSKYDDIIDERRFRLDPSNFKPHMSPPSPDEKVLLYDGFTKEEKGRWQYLRSRKLKIPESKYEYPLTNQWDLGWKLKDTFVEYKSPENGRSRIVRDTFYRPNKIFYKPISSELMPKL